MTTDTKKQHLFCPGPVQLAENVKRAAIEHEIGHREPEFSELLTSINNQVLGLFNVQDKDKYQPVIVSGSGTAANECVLSSVVGNGKILVVSNGEFGERLAEIASLHNTQTIHLRFEWGEIMRTQEIEDAIKKHHADFVAIVHHETSTGMLNPIVDIGALVKKCGAAFIVDTVSSAGAEDISIEDAHITFLTTSASKAIGSLPGVSIVVGKKEAFEALKNVPARTVYLNLYKFYRFAVDRIQTPNTPAVQSFFALEQALHNIESQHEAHFARTKHMAGTMRNGLEKLGIRFLLPKEQMSVVLTTVYAPDHISVAEIKTQLRERGIIVYDGKGPLTGKVFQISTIGNLSPEQTRFFLKNLGEVLNSGKEVRPVHKSLFGKIFAPHEHR